jgi:hypothetical protein
MRRRKLVATAGVLSVTAFAATVAIGANFGLVGQAAPDLPVGQLGPKAPAAHAVSAGAPVTAVPATVPADD